MARQLVEHPVVAPQLPLAYPGKKIHRWTLLSKMPYNPNKKRRNARWNVMCECDKMSTADEYDLLNNRTTECNRCAAKASWLKRKGF